MTMRSFLLAALAVATIVTAVPASAQQPAPRPPAAAQPQQPQLPPLPPPQPPGPLAPAFIGVVSMLQVQQHASAFRGVQQQLEAFARTMQTELGNRDGQLRNQEQELQRLQQSLPPQQFQERVRAFEAQVASFQRNAAARRDQLEEAGANARRQIDTVLVAILQEIATARSLNLILSREGALLSANDLDITAEVVQRLNQRLARVNVTLPALRQAN